MHYGRMSTTSQRAVASRPILAYRMVVLQAAMSAPMNPHNSAILAVTKANMAYRQVDGMVRCKYDLLRYYVTTFITYHMNHQYDSYDINYII